MCHHGPQASVVTKGAAISRDHSIASCIWLCIACMNIGRIERNESARRFM